MKRISYTITLALSLLLLVACEKEVPYDAIGFQPTPVLNALPSDGERLFLNFGLSRLMLDTTAATPINGALVSLRIGNQLLHPDSVSHCNYFFNATPSPHDRVSVNITLADGRTVSASTTVPATPQVSNVVSSIDTSEVFNLGIINFDLADEPNYRNYYHITVMQRDSGTRRNLWRDTLETIDTTFPTYFLCPYTPLLTGAASSEALGGYFYASLLTSDSLFDGQVLPSNLLLMLLVDTTEVQPFLHQYTLQVESISEERFRYLYDVTTHSSLTSAFAEAAPTYSNVSGGLGLFAGSSRRTFKLDIDPSILQPSASRTKSSMLSTKLQQCLQSVGPHTIHRSAR